MILSLLNKRPFLTYRGWSGGHNCPGVEQPLTSFYFAEGTTRAGFDEWLTIMNPGDTPAQVQLTYMFASGQWEAQAQVMSVGPHNSATVSVAAAVGLGKDVSIKLESSTPVVAERPLYFDYNGEVKGGDCAVGFGR